MGVGGGFMKPHSGVLTGPPPAERAVLILHAPRRADKLMVCAVAAASSDLIVLEASRVQCIRVCFVQMRPGAAHRPVFGAAKRFTATCVVSFGHCAGGMRLLDTAAGAAPPRVYGRC